MMPNKMSWTTSVEKNHFKKYHIYFIEDRHLKFQSFLREQWDYLATIAYQEPATKNPPRCPQHQGDLYQFQQIAEQYLPWIGSKVSCYIRIVLERTGPTAHMCISPFLLSS